MFLAKIGSIKVYRYYLIQRGPGPGAIPKPWDDSIIDVKDYGTKIYIGEIDREAWGHVEYKYPLNSKSISDYELSEAKGQNRSIIMGS